MTLSDLYLCCYTDRFFSCPSFHRYAKPTIAQILHSVDFTFLAILVSENEKRDQNFGMAYINGFDLFAIKNFQLYDLI